MKEMQTSRQDITQTRIVDSPFDPDATLAIGELICKIDKFGFSANNVTYAAAGDQLGYWQFFPPADDEAGTWGIIPVWGFAEVVSSNVEGIDVGERIFGYFPTSSYLKMQNVQVHEKRLVDGADHRAKLPPGYNTYRRLNAEPDYDRGMDELRMLLWPLYATSFCLWDSLQDKSWHDCSQVLVISASSKTSIGLAYALDADNTAPKSVGLTSAKNKDWVQGLALYDNVASYDSIATIDRATPTVIVDMSGNSALLAQLYDHLGDNLVHCLNVGLTHWSEGGKGSGIPQERREFFFAPSHIQMRMKQWGPAEFESKSSQFIYDAARKSASWMEIERLKGVEELAASYEAVCKGKLAPAKALVIEQ